MTSVPVADVVVTRECGAPVHRLWEVATDWTAHGRFFPLTTVRVVTDGRRVGGRIEATTRLGPLRLLDPMIVTKWEPPGERGRCELRKVGRLLGGRTVLAVEPTAAGSRLHWSTDVGPASPLLRKVLAPLSRITSAPLYRHVVRGIVREAEHG